MDAKAKAESIFYAVSIGQTVFTRNGDMWMIVGPSEDIQPGKQITVVKADGELVPVIVDEIGSRREKRGVAYAVATFHKAPKSRPRTESVAPRTYRVKHSPLYGTGRVYDDTPGATHYDNGTTQIWDES